MNIHHIYDAHIVMQNATTYDVLQDALDSRESRYFKDQYLVEVLARIIDRVAKDDQDKLDLITPHVWEINYEAR